MVPKFPRRTQDAAFRTPSFRALVQGFVPELAYAQVSHGLPELRVMDRSVRRHGVPSDGSSLIVDNPQVPIVILTDYRGGVACAKAVLS